MQSRLLITVFLLAVTLVCPAQELSDDRNRADAGREADFSPPDTRVTLAISSPAYPVTPGDTYRLVYVLPSGVETTGSFTVDAGYDLPLGHLGSVNARHLTLPELRTKVEATVRRNYPTAYPQLDLVSVGLFRVFVSGAVERAGWIDAWGLTHLSSVLEGRLAEQASRRAVERSAGEDSRGVYDLVAAERLGNVDNDPLVRPGDRITVPYSDRRVTIAGEVRRPGRYDLLPEEGFDELMGLLAGGPTAHADLSSVEITSLGDEPGSRDAYRTFNFGRGQPPELQDQDSIYVPSVRENNPVVYVSIRFGTEVSTLRHRLRDGDTLLTVMQAVLLRPGRRAANVSEVTVSPDSLSLARIQRQGSTFKRVNIEALVFGGDHSLDMPLQPGDTVVVP